MNQLEEEKMRRNEEELKKISSGIGKVGKNINLNNPGKFVTLLK